MSLIIPVSIVNSSNIRYIPEFLSNSVTTTVYDILNFSDYSQIVTGEFDSVNGSTKQNIVGLDKLGGIQSDKSTPILTTSPYDEIVYITEFKKDYGASITDDLLVCGSFLSMNGISTKYLARLDKNFNVHPNQFPQTLNGSVYTIDVYNPNSVDDPLICVVGGFTAPRGKIMIYTLDTGNTITPVTINITISGTARGARFVTTDGVLVYGQCNVSTRHGIAKVVTFNGQIVTAFDANISSNNAERDVAVMDFVNKDLIAPDILIGGNFKIGSTFYSIARLDYYTGGIVGSWATNLDNTARVSALYYENNVDSPNYNKILCATQSALYLLDGATGIVDTTFNNNIGYVSVSGVNVIKTIENGKIVIGGSFDNINGDTSKRVYAILSPDGSEVF